MGDDISPEWFMIEFGERDQLINMPCVHTHIALRWVRTIPASCRVIFVFPDSFWSSKSASKYGGTYLPKN